MTCGSGDMPPETARRHALATLAKSTPGELAGAVALLAVAAHAVDLKPVETGLVMLRGRIGGDGPPFNLGEATVTRAVVQLSTGEIGYGHRLGRDKAAARDAAIIDAAWQSIASREFVEMRILAPIRARVTSDHERASEETASSRVEFFTLARETA